MQEAGLEAALALIVGMGIYWVVYSLVLFVLMKMQGWHIGPIALLGSTALATFISQGISMLGIPMIGPFVGTAVLVICVWKASGSDLTDSVFSVVIAGALMFAFQIFALTALMGELNIGAVAEEEEVDADGVVQVEATSFWGGDSKDPLLYLKGITLSSNDNMVLVGSGTANYAFTNGERAMIKSPRGRLNVLCEMIETNQVIMKVEFEERIYRIPLVLPGTLELTPEP